MRNRWNKVGPEEKVGPGIKVVAENRVEPPCASVCIHMHPPHIRMHPYTSIRPHYAPERQYSTHMFVEMSQKRIGTSNRPEFAGAAGRGPWGVGGAVGGGPGWREGWEGRFRLGGDIHWEGEKEE